MSLCQTCNDVGATGPADNRVLCPDCPLDFTDYGMERNDRPPPPPFCPECRAGLCRCDPGN